MPTVATARLACIVVLAALASEAAAIVPEVPGDDIFGFSTPTDVGNPGDTPASPMKTMAAPASAAAPIARSMPGMS